MLSALERKTLVSSHTITTPPHLGSQTHPLVPGKEIRKVVEFLGLGMIAGLVDLESFDLIVNSLIKACHDDVQCELFEIKRKIKFILAQCERVDR